MPPLPSTKLANIKLGLAESKKITIYHQETEDDAKVLMHSAYPKDLAIAFSGFFAQAFNAVPVNQIPLSELKPNTKTSVVVEGGKFKVLRAILEWMLSCGKVGKTIPFRWFNSPAFFDYGLVLLAAEKLQIDVLKAQVLSRMQDIARVQVHSIDVERVFTSFSGPHKFKDMICQSIGRGQWEGRLQAHGAYKALFGMPEYAEFKTGTDAAYDQLEKQWLKTPEGKIAKKEQEEKQDKNKEKREAAKGRREGNFTQSPARRHKTDSENVTLTGDGNYTVVVEGRPVRKAQEGRPSFVKLELASLGVTKQQFRPREPRTPPRN